MGKAVTFRLLTTIAIFLLIVIYFSPIWWVSLEAPNYPPETFPDGVRIHFHVNGVFNGCKVRNTDEIEEIDALDCVHEMDTINHYVGMYPIASAAPIERTLSAFLFAFLIALLIAFMVSGAKFQASILTVGFSIIVVWMYMTLFIQGNVSWMSEGYQYVLQTNMDMELEEFQEWSNNKSGFEIMQESYRDTLGIYFREPLKIEWRVGFLAAFTYVVIGVLIISMLIFIIGLIWQNNLFYWLLVMIPILLPAFFVLDYAGWLWWFGHNLHPNAPFTLKPFMPTVLGNGKVAQFTTHSYPYYGYGLMVLSSLLLLIAGLVRRKQLREN